MVKAPRSLSKVEKPVHRLRLALIAPLPVTVLPP
jgi:hypothetical protein